MSGFLVFYCCNLDDVPVQMFKTLTQARTRCRGKKPKDNVLAVMDESGFVCWKILEFKDGKPVKLHDPKLPKPRGGGSRAAA